MRWKAIVAAVQLGKAEAYYRAAVFTLFPTWPTAGTGTLAG